ncbi:MAG: hypothetical protein ACOX5R_07590 [bacterium]
MLNNPLSKNTVFLILSLVALLLCPMTAVKPVAAQDTKFVKLFPFDAALAQHLNQMLEDENIQFVENPDRNPDTYLFTLQWDTTARSAYGKPGNSDEPVNLRDVPYETKKHRMQVMKKEAQEEKKRGDNIFSRLFNRDRDAKGESTSTSNANPYQTKRHRIAATSDREEEGFVRDRVPESPTPAETAVNDYDQAETVPSAPVRVQSSRQETVREEPVRESGKSGNFFSRIFGSRDTDQDSSYQSSANRFDTKPHRLRYGRQAAEQNDVPETLNLADERDYVPAQETQLPLRSAVETETHANARKPAQPVQESGLVTTLEESEQAGTNVQEEQIEYEPIMEPEPESKNFIAAIGETITRPFADWETGTSYTVESKLIFMDGRRLTLPEVKTRDEAEMQHIFAEMVSQAAQWVKQGNRKYITALNSAAGVRSMQDLEEKIQRVNENPDWLR